MTHATNWLPGILMMAGGLAAGTTALIFTRGRSPTLGGGRDSKQADLEHRVSFLLEQLRALDTERRQLGEERYAEDKSRLEQEAAEALRARDAFVPPQSAPVPARAQGAGFFARHPQLVGAAWGGGVVLFFAALWFVLGSQERSRGEGQMTGVRPPGSGQMAQAGNGAAENPHDEDNVFAAALERARANPGDLEASSFAVHELIRRQEFPQAGELTQQALAADPFHVETRIHKAVLRATDGDFDGALKDLGTIGRTWPDAHEAWLFRGALAMQTGDSAVALESFERFVAAAPADEQPPQLQSAIAMLRQKLAR